MSRGVNSMQPVGGCIMRRRARNNKNTQSTGELKQFSVKQSYILQSDRQQRNKNISSLLHLIWNIKHRDNGWIKYTLIVIDVAIC